MEGMLGYVLKKHFESYHLPDNRMTVLFYNCQSDQFSEIDSSVKIKCHVAGVRFHQKFLKQNNLENGRLILSGEWRRFNFLEDSLGPEELIFNHNQYRQDNETLMLCDSPSRPFRDLPKLTNIMPELAEVDPGLLGNRPDARLAARVRFNEGCFYAGKRSTHVEGQVSKWRFAEGGKLVPYAPFFDMHLAAKMMLHISIEEGDELNLNLHRIHGNEPTGNVVLKPRACGGLRPRIVVDLFNREADHLDPGYFFPVDRKHIEDETPSERDHEFGFLYRMARNYSTLDPRSLFIPFPIRNQGAALVIPHSSNHICSGVMFGHHPDA